MIITTTAFSLPTPLTREEARKIFLSTAPTYIGAQGLLQKHYVLSQDGLRVGGVYLWNSRKDAEAMFTDAWRTFVTAKYNTEPVLTYFDSPVTVDNVAGKILSNE